MTFPNAFNGVKKLFTSEILALIAGICTVIAAIGALAIVGGSDAGGILLIIFALAALVLAIIGYIMMLIGLKRAGHDENRFNQAFIVAIAVLVLSAVSSIFTSAGVGGGIPSAIMDFVKKVGDVVIAILVINGVQNLASKLDNDQILKKGNTLLIILAIVNGLAAITSLISAFCGGSIASKVGGVFSLISGILSIVYYILFIIFLAKSKKMQQDG